MASAMEIVHIARRHWHPLKVVNRVHFIGLVPRANLVPAVRLHALCGCGLALVRGVDENKRVREWESLHFDDPSANFTEVG
jgi:hypothetical protein